MLEAAQVTSIHDQDDLGERLAGWIDGLGLAAHLAQAGLPSFTRDAQGRAVWIDPGTQQELTTKQLEGLDRLLHSDGSEPEHAVPVSLVLIARQARLHTELLGTAWFSYETLADLRGASVDSTRYAVHKAASTNQLLVVPTGETVVVPAFQLTPQGELRADLAPVLEPLLAAGMDPWHAWAWLTQPAALLGGRIPEQAVAEQDGTDLVRHAAVRLAERVGTS
jgi:hypothetical protein